MHPLRSKAEIQLAGYQTLMSLIAFGSPKTAYYRDILIRANPALHAEAIEVLKLAVPAGAKFIDVGAGQGAFSLRLQDSGFDVVAVDTNAPDFKATSVPYTKLDFNSVLDVGAFLGSESCRYDCVVGMEVIEHVENPWDYFRFLTKLAKEGGIIFITTPNTQSALSKIQYCFENKHAHFADGDYEVSGHINPLTIWEIELIAKEIDLEVIKIDSLCSIPKFTVSRNIRYMLYGIINLIFGWSMGRVRNGDILYILARKKSS
jgi:2-polyprenyl-3-methyl-5-hydroxy-6-metoxy-1,4-benzoquinol methylase